MWLILMILLASGGEIFCKSCEGIDGACYSEDIPRYLPLYKEQYDNGCREIKPFIRCYRDFHEECTDDDDDVGQKRIAFIRHLVGLLDRWCDTETSIYRAMTENVRCITHAILQGYASCKDQDLGKEKRNFTMTYADMLLKRGLVDSNETCVESMWVDACVSLFVSENCGEELLDPTLEIFIGIDYHLYVTCDEEWAAEVPEFARALALFEKQAENAEDEIREKK